MKLMRTPHEIPMTFPQNLTEFCEKLLRFGDDDDGDDTRQPRSWLPADGALRRLCRQPLRGQPESAAVRIDSPVHPAVSR